MPHRLNAYLASDQGLRHLSGKAREVIALQRHYESIAPAPLAQNSQVLRLSQQTLLIAAGNGAVAAKLRQMTGELISLFQARGCEVTGIQIRVQVAVPRRTVAVVPRKLGKAAREALNKLDENLADSPLKRALKRLSQRA